MKEKKDDLEMRIKKAKMDPVLVSRQIEDFIIKEVTEAGKSGGMVGLSGGIDSTTVAYLAKRAFDRYNSAKPDKEQLRLYGLVMPAGKLGIDDAEDAQETANMLDIDCKVIDICPVLEARKKLNPEIFSKSLKK